jgi:16S rRNA (uracil1498-N3)-methyltransferase
MMPCFYTPALKKEDKKIDLNGDEFHHIAHVFRKTVNDEIALTNGKGILAKAKISFLTKRFLTLKIISISEEQQSDPKAARIFINLYEIC